MAFGKMLYRDPTFVEGGNGISVYNNSGNGTVTITRTSSSTVPNDSGKMLTIKNTGTASPYCGVFHLLLNVDIEKIFITRIIAKIPVGRDITFHTNSMGTEAHKNGLLQLKVLVIGKNIFVKYIVVHPIFHQPIFLQLPVLIMLPGI